VRIRTFVQERLSAVDAALVAAGGRCHGGEDRSSEGDGRVHFDARGEGKRIFCRGKKTAVLTVSLGRVPMSEDMWLVLMSAFQLEVERTPAPFIPLRHSYAQVFQT